MLRSRAAEPSGTRKDRCPGRIHVTSIPYYPVSITQNKIKQKKTKRWGTIPPAADRSFRFPPKISRVDSGILSASEERRQAGDARRARGDELLRFMDGASDEPLPKDYYKVLEVDYDASDDTIKLNYKRLALMWHPDKHKGDNDVTAKFQEINEAYTVLSDPVKRLEYDVSGSYEINRYTLREYLTRFKGMILTCNGLGMDDPSKWVQHLRELEPH